MNGPKGQILPGTPFGELLRYLAQASEVILEIGTWKGLGSTLCLSRGLVRPMQRMWTIENDTAMFNEARRYYKDRRITFLNGDALSFVNQIPQRIDLLLLDGGNETTDQEFDALHHRCQIIALDDTKDRKNIRQRKLLKEMGWIPIADVLNERLGWAVFSNPKN